jgi:calcineurin-like phosphoesterase family protein
MIHFVGDTHLGHQNIIRYCDRPFGSMEEHDTALIRGWNEVVAPDDEVWHLGDFAWWHLPEEQVREMFRKLHGYVHLILGNHDLDQTGEPRAVLRELFGDRLHWYKELVVTPEGRRARPGEDGQYVVLFHYALRRWQGWFSKEGRASWHLYGHHHGRLPGAGLSMDVGVDCHDYHPVPWTRIVEKLGKPRRKERGT